MEKKWKVIILEKVNNKICCHGKIFDDVMDDEIQESPFCCFGFSYLLYE